MLGASDRAAAQSVACPAPKHTTAAPDHVSVSGSNGVRYASNPPLLGGGWLSWPDQGDIARFQTIEVWAYGWPRPLRQRVNDYMPDFGLTRLWWRPICGPNE